METNETIRAKIAELKAIAEALPDETDIASRAAQLERVANELETAVSDHEKELSWSGMGVPL